MTESNQKAIEDLYNRFLGKPKETIEVNDQDRELLLGIQRQNRVIIEMGRRIELGKIKGFHTYKPQPPAQKVMVGQKEE